MIKHYPTTNDILMFTVKLPCLCLVFLLSLSLKAEVLFNSLDPSLEIGNDCSASAMRMLSLSIPSATNLDLAKEAPYNHIILLHSAQDLSEQQRAARQGYRSAYGPKALQHVIFWQEQSLQWLNAYSSNQSQLSLKPLLALSRHNEGPLAFAIVSLSSKQQLASVLQDDFIAQRSPLVISLTLPTTLSQTEQELLASHGFDNIQRHSQLLLTKGVTVCDRGNDGATRHWISFEKD